MQRCYFYEPWLFFLVPNQESSPFPQWHLSTCPTNFLTQILEYDKFVFLLSIVNQTRLTWYHPHTITTRCLYTRIICGFHTISFESILLSRSTYANHLNGVRVHNVSVRKACHIGSHVQDSSTHVFAPNLASTIRPQGRLLQVLAMIGYIGYYQSTEETVFDEQRNSISLLAQCSCLRSLQIVRVDLQYITVNEGAAFLELSAQQLLNVREFRGGSIEDSNPAPKVSMLRKVETSAAILPIGLSTE